jgi:hypothetical protein
MLRSATTGVIFFILTLSIGHAQLESAQNVDAFVDHQGVLRWRGTNEEVRLFGVNYTTPFAYAFRAHKRLGLSLKHAIDLDVAQFARLGLDAFRVHVWDREISDAEGNLLANEHLELFDYLLAQLAGHGIKSIVTPIAWWGNGWPEPDEKTSGFSQQYSKTELITNQSAREAQRNYLRQFMNHVNPHRKLAIKNDPSIIAVEIINEPRHPDDPAMVTAYVNEMAGVLRDAGLTKPIFYNISENWTDVQATAVAAAHVDGVSFQWYPTDLVHRRMLKGNYLLNVDQYAIPSANVAGYTTMAKMVYEFDAADVGGSYMYPAMARSFRGAGMQFATMFAYDPVQIAWSNTEYPTHFVNLLYAPSKALSLMIAGKAFRSLPLSQTYGRYPANNHFGDFSVNADLNLSEMNAASEFIYSNSTGDMPRSPDSLEHVAGCGSSAMVKYDGNGAYFLDKLEKGIWRLEVYPDVIWSRDPFQPTSLSREVARLFWQERRMTLSIPDLGARYVLHPMSEKAQQMPGDSLSPGSVTPGVFLVTAADVEMKRVKKHLVKRAPFLKGLYTPAPAPSGFYVTNKTVGRRMGSKRAEFRFQIAGERPVTEASVFFRRPGWRGFAKLQLRTSGGLDYSVVDSSLVGQAGECEYCVAVRSGGTLFTFPGENEGSPERWDFLANDLWKMNLLEPDKPIALLDISRDMNDIVLPHFSSTMKYGVNLGHGATNEETALTLKVNFAPEAVTPCGIQLDISEIMDALRSAVGGYHSLLVRARSLSDSCAKLDINLLMSDGRTYTASIIVSHEWPDRPLPLGDFHHGESLVLPAAYPLFLPQVRKSLRVLEADTPDLRLLEKLQVIVDPASVSSIGGKKEAVVEIVSIQLRQ